MKPAASVKNIFPVIFIAFCNGKTASAPVINYLRRPLARTVFKVINTEPSRLTERINTDAVISQACGGGFSHGIVGKRRHIAYVFSKNSKAHSNVCFAAAKNRLKAGRLEQSFFSRRFEPQHKLTKKHYFFHIKKNKREIW